MNTNLDEIDSFSSDPSSGNKSKDNRGFKNKRKQQMRALGMNTSPSSTKFMPEAIRSKIEQMENEDPNGVDIADLDAHSCRWPVYRTEEGQNLFCGKQVVDRTNNIAPYCETHRKRAVRKDNQIDPVQKQVDLEISRDIGTDIDRQNRQNRQDRKNTEGESKEG